MNDNQCFTLSFQDVRNYFVDANYSLIRASYRKLYFKSLTLCRTRNQQPEVTPLRTVTSDVALLLRGQSRLVCGDIRRQ